jgi:hypothetical protein
MTRRNFSSEAVASEV